jgi:hypothetical protein
MMIFEELHSHALPKDMRVWNALHGGYSWVITYDPGSYEWTDSELSTRAGYRATFARLGDPAGPKIPVKGGPFKTFAKAEAACKAAWRSI